MHENIPLRRSPKETFHPEKTCRDKTRWIVNMDARRVKWISIYDHTHVDQRNKQIAWQSMNAWKWSKCLPGFPRVGRKRSELILLVIRNRRRSHFCLSAEISTMEKKNNIILIITIDVEVGWENKNDIYFVKFYSLCNGAGPILARVHLTTP